jgi:hypothetical protein
MNFKRSVLVLQPLFSLLTVILLLNACSPVKNFQPNKPFVFANKIVVNGNLSKDEKKRLTTELENYWDDSLRARKVSEIKISFRQAPISKVLRNPPLYDSSKVTRSKAFMNAYLNSQGYYYTKLNDSFFIQTPKRYSKRNQGQLRTTVIIKIDLGNNITIDSVSYALVDTTHRTTKDSMLQQLAMQQFPKTQLKKGSTYTKQKISDELDRLVTWFRQNGYYKFTREHIYALVDTTNEKLFKLTLDPIELARVITEAEQKRKENPEWDIFIKQRPTKDTTILNRYYVNNIYYYPETKITDFPDSLMSRKWNNVIVGKRSGLTIRAEKGLFKLRPLREHTFLRKDSIYHEDVYLKTINTFSRIPAWQQVDAKIVENGKDSLDLHFFLIPQKKYQTNYNLEGSRNSGDFTAGNLLGVSLSATLNNRNVWKQAIQSSTNLRGGVELNLLKVTDTSSAKDNLIQTLQFSISHNYSFPRLIMPKFISNLKIFDRAENKRTLLSASLAYTERFEIFRLRSGNFNLGYEGQVKNGDVYLWKPINLELYSIDTLPGLIKLFETNPFLRNSFNTGNVIGLGLGVINFNRTRTSLKNPNNTHLIRLGFEESGLLTSVVPALEDKVYRFIKLEAEYRLSQKKLKSEMAYRIFAGVGIPLGGQSLPFFKQYFAGGPNSMRAWNLRQLGLGSSILSDTISSTSFRDRFGDMQLEANVEYRFNIATIGGFKIGSALFADIGNVWNLKKDANNTNGEFSLKRFYQDIAVGVGTGLRFDFSYFLIRVDFAYKVKDPGRLTNNGWMSIQNFKWTEQRNNINRTEIKNFGFQLGIGLPF